MKKIIFDCDNTFGVPGCDLDDGLALLYLLGTHQAELLGITTTYGNSTIDIVDANTRHMLQTIGHSEIPVARGSGVPGSACSEAAEFLCTMVDRYPGEIGILATGSMTNLLAAYHRDPQFFEKVQEISLMGGITAPLVIGNKVLEELNFSCDVMATLCVLEKGHNIRIATGNNCMGAFFTREQCDKRLKEAGFATWLHKSMQYWFTREKDTFGHAGIYKWDVYAAACLLEPEWFRPEPAVITPTQASLSTGYLLGEGAEIHVFLPQVRDGKAFTEHVYDCYMQNEIA